jgi:hypothetical protein
MYVLFKEHWSKGWKERNFDTNFSRLSSNYPSVSSPESTVSVVATDLHYCRDYRIHDGFFHAGRQIQDFNFGG